MLAEILGVARRLLPLAVAAPLEVPARHVGPIAHAKEQRALRSIDVFVQLARPMPHDRAGHTVEGAARGAHLAAALEAKIDLGRVGMTVIGADRARLPPRPRDAPPADLAENLLDVMLGIPL